MKKLLALTMVALSLQATRAEAQPESLRLLLVPVETSIKPGAAVSFDVYLYNSTAHSKKVGSLNRISAMYRLQDITGARQPRDEAWSQIIADPPPDTVLRSNGVEHTRIEIKIPSEPGDLVSIYVEMGATSSLRSNSALLFCPAEGKTARSTSSPKAAITPNGKR